MDTKSTTKGNLFTKAAKSAPTKKVAAKDEKIRIKIEDPSFFTKVEKLEQLNDTLKSSKAKADMISDELRDLGKDEFAKLYKKIGRNPESVMLEHVNANGDTAQIMVCPSDRYITINSERAETLREEFGEEIVEEKTTFAFDLEMVEKYGEVLSRLIEESEEISERDKEKIIKAVTVFSVAKGTIDKLDSYGDVAEVMESVKPVVALRNIEVIKG